jgi:ribosomal protein S12 methylthiotransferase accessory factor
MITHRAVVFLGPSLALERARSLLDADYRPPARRGDFVCLPGGTVVGLIDGVFEQDLAVSPREVSDALARGVVVFGGSSMGALRAAEISGMHGVGRVYEWYRDGLVSRDDEVALLFHPEIMRPLTVPTVNVRYAVQRLRSAGTIDEVTATALLRGAEQLHFKERTYRRILEVAGLAERGDSDDLTSMLAALDIKAQDAQDVLEAIDRHLLEAPSTTSRGDSRSAVREVNPSLPNHASLADSMLIWESGDQVSELELWRFLAITGRLFALAEGVMAQQPLPAVDAAIPQQQVQEFFTRAAARWGWMSSDEAVVTLADLKLNADVIGTACAAATSMQARAQAAIFEGTPEFQEAIRVHLFLNDMGLKREVMRVASLDYFAAQAIDDPSPTDLDAARTVLCKLHGVLHFSMVRRRLASVGLHELTGVEASVTHLAKARLAAQALCKRILSRDAPSPPPIVGLLGLQSSPKPTGERRFGQTQEASELTAQKIASRIGITRIGMIGELGALGDIQIAQAARPGNAWSSSYGSGKARTKAGAIIGSIMEECEKWAQEHFAPEEPLLLGSFEKLNETAAVVDPATLDLPYDSVYSPKTELSWCCVADLMRAVPAYLPIDVLDLRRRKHDICYTSRGARKHLATNGLGAGFAMADAVLHGLCEYVERHAQRIAELYLSNPGGLGAPPYRFVEPHSGPEPLRLLVRDLEPRVDALRVLDITSEVGIPTFAAALVREGRIANGYGAHSDPATAVEMALLEAAQTIASAVAGGREDLSVHARSLGRHERPRPVDANSAWFWMDPDVRRIELDDVSGACSGDVLDDLMWCIARLSDAGISQVLACDLSHAEIAPIKVARVIIPGLETNNPFYTGPRARLTLLRDLVPRLT